MRILYLTQWFDPEPILKGAAFAKGLADRGHHVEVVTGYPNYPTGKLFPGYRMSLYRREVVDGITVHRLPLYPSHDSSSVGRTLNYLSFFVSVLVFCLLRGRRFDAVYAYPPPTVALAGIMAGWIVRTPLVLDVQDLWPDSVVRSGMRGTSRMGGLLSRLCNFVYRRSARIVVQSQGMKARLVERGVPAARLHVVHNWADESAARPGGLCDLSPYEFEGRFNVVYGGNLGRVQGLDTLVRAAHLAARDEPRIQLLLIGDGIEAGRLRKLVAELGAINVRIAPAVAPALIGDVFAAADVLVMHLWADPLFEITIPHKTQFYLAMARPVLVGAKGEAADIVVNAGAGIAVPPQDPQAMAAAMIAMARTPPAELAAMGERGRAAYWQSFSFATAIAATERALTAAVEAAKRSART